MTIENKIRESDKHRHTGRRDHDGYGNGDHGLPIGDIEIPGSNTLEKPTSILIP